MDTENVSLSFSLKVLKSLITFVLLKGKTTDAYVVICSKPKKDMKDVDIQLQQLGMIKAQKSPTVTNHIVKKIRIFWGVMHADCFQYVICLTLNNPYCGVNDT